VSERETERVKIELNKKRLKKKETERGRVEGRDWKWIKWTKRRQIFRENSKRREEWDEREVEIEGEILRRRKEM